MNLYDRLGALAERIDRDDGRETATAPLDSTVGDPRRSTSLSLGLVAAVLVVIGLAGVLIVRADRATVETVAGSEDTDQSGPTSLVQTSQPSWRLVATAMEGNRWSTAVSLAPEETQSSLDLVGVTGEYELDLDWSREILVLLASPTSSSCPEQTVVAFGTDGRDGSRLFPTLGLQSGGAQIVDCGEDAEPRVFFVAVERTSLPSEFVVSPTGRAPCSSACTAHTLTEVDLEAGITRQRSG